MRFRLADHGGVFSTRPRGTELLALLEREAKDASVVEIDFEDVRNVSYSFVDEFVGELAERASRRDAFEIALANVPARMERIIASSLERRGVDQAVLVHA
jgi:STAS-like domain of unknown function (DUF4325)